MSDADIEQKREEDERLDTHLDTAEEPNEEVRHDPQDESMRHTPETVH
jgi:hypothetical protein